MKSFAKTTFKTQALEELGLPNIEYPVPADKIKLIFSLNQKLSPSVLIYWIMEYMSENINSRDYYEKALLEICEKHAPISGNTEFWYNAKSKYTANPDQVWCLKLGKVNLKNTIVSFQYGNKIYLAVRKSLEDKTKIEVSFFTAPHLNLIFSLRTFSIDPHIKMLSKPEDAIAFSYLQYLTEKMHFCLKEGEKKDIIVNWEYGLGWNSPDVFDKNYGYVQNLNPIPNDWIAFLFNIVLECEKNKTFENLVGEQGRGL